MTITKENAEIIYTKDVYLHDDVLISFSFNREEKKLVLNLEKRKTLIVKEPKPYEMHFINVVGFYMTACDFWGKSERILCFDHLDSCNRKFIESLSKKEIEYSVEDAFKIRFDNFLETMFTFCSGDTLRIVCEKIELLD